MDRIPARSRRRSAKRRPRSWRSWSIPSIRCTSRRPPWTWTTATTRTAGCRRTTTRVRPPSLPSVGQRRSPTEMPADPPADAPPIDDRPEVERPLSRRLVAEVAGTFALVFVAVGGDAMASLAGAQISTAARAVAPGLMVGALIYAIGDVSGAHFNPVVTAAFALKRLFPPRLVVAYWMAQLVGGLAAALVVGQLIQE